MQTLHSITGLSARIFELPGREPFMLAADLAEAYGTSAERISQQVSRNAERFPEDFAFRLTEAEAETLRLQNAGTKPVAPAGRSADLRSQNATANAISTMVRYAPIVFTHAGAVALSGVLKTSVAASVSVVVHRAFAALEKRAQAETRFLLARLRTERGRMTPLRALAVLGTREGLSFLAIWLSASYSKPRLTQELHTCLAAGLIDALPAGTPALQPDLFGLPAEG